MANSWRPRRKGRVYCASACGGGCTFAQYQRAVAEANKLAKQLGKPWRAKVNENLGWWASAEWRTESGDHTVFRNDRNMHPKRLRGGSWCALLANGRYCGYSKVSPLDAVNNALLVVVDRKYLELETLLVNFI